MPISPREGQSHGSTISTGQRRWYGRDVKRSDEGFQGAPSYLESEKGEKKEKRHAWGKERVCGVFIAATATRDVRGLAVGEA